MVVQHLLVCQNPQLEEYVGKNMEISEWNLGKRGLGDMSDLSRVQCHTSHPPEDLTSVICKSNVIPEDLQTWLEGWQNYLHSLC